MKKITNKKSVLTAVFISLILTLTGCGDEAKEANKVILPVVSDGSGMSAFKTAQGYDVEIQLLKIAVQDFEFTIKGETHTGMLEKLERIIFPKAYAHPGHLAGGEVTGELPGNFILEPTHGEDVSLGDGTLLEGEYHGMNFTFRKASAEDKSDAQDPIQGHTIHVKGISMKGDVRLNFDALIDIDENTKMVGAPFTLNLTAKDSDWVLEVKVLPMDPSTEGDTLFDGIDFESLDDDHDGNIQILPGSDAHNILKRRFQVHDHYWVEPRRK